jgi:hypothetical protein
MWRVVTWYLLFSWRWQWRLSPLGRDVWSCVYIYYCEGTSACGADDLQIRQRRKCSSRYSMQPTLEQYRKFMYSLVIISTVTVLVCSDVRSCWKATFAPASLPALANLHLISVIYQPGIEKVISQSRDVKLMRVVSLHLLLLHSSSDVSCNTRMK